MSSSPQGNVQQIVSDLILGRSRAYRESVDREVAAVVVVEDDVRFLPETLKAVLEQDVMPGTIVVADCTGQTKHPVHSAFSVRVRDLSGSRDALIEQVDMQMVRVSGARSFCDAVNRALQYANLARGVHSLWMLHDDSRPADNRCLAALTDTKRNTPTASLLGAKQLDWNGEHVHNVGYYEGRHRLESLVVDGEPDQEQYDGRTDVFAVSLAGALVPLQSLKQFRGINPWFGSMGEAGDFSRRICLEGGRVIVVPQARIAHRRARAEGIRTKSGQPVDESNPQDTSRERFKSITRYAYTDMTGSLWPLAWLVHLVVSVAGAIRELFSKRPLGAWSAISMPWYMLSALFPALRARGMVRRSSKVAISKLPMLRADSRQVSQWRQRRNMFESQKHVVLLSPLAKSHLRERRIKRWSGALAVALVAFTSVVAAYWDVFRSVLSGAALYSDSVASSAATMGALFSSATTPWAFGVGTGAAAPPSPWNLVWFAASLLTLGHTTASLALLFFASAPLAALSMWALAGIFTRSNFVRAAVSLLWVSLAWGTGLFDSLNLPMLTVMMFLPAAFAFSFRAVGLYRTEDPVTPHSSIQMAACASLSFIPVVCAEPQLLLPLIIMFLVFVIMVKRHRAMLLLTPLPAAFALVPTLVHAVRYAGLGFWRELFGDVAGPGGADAAPASINFIGVLTRAFGLPHVESAQDILALSPETFAVMAAVAAVVVMAMIALLRPKVCRAARMMWVMVICGAVLSLVAVRVSTAWGSAGLVSGSVLPGVTFMILACLSAICLASGAAVRKYIPLRRSAEDPSGNMQSSLSAAAQIEGSSATASGGARMVAVRMWRAVLVVVLLAVTVIWSCFGLWTHERDVHASASGLPMVARDYLEKNSDHRVLALRAESGNKVEYAVMRTGRGDLMDTSPSWNAQQVSGVSDQADSTLAAAAAQLLSNSDDDAIRQIGALGFGGLYVVNDTSTGAEDASQALIGNVGASDGVQSVVSADAGTYYQIISDGSSAQSVSNPGQAKAQENPWRDVWMWTLIVLVVVYFLLALPRVRRYGQEQA